MRRIPARIVASAEEPPRSVACDLARRALAFALAATPAACGYDHATNLQVRDPSALTLRRDWPGESSVVLPGGEAPLTATISRGTVPTGHGSRARFRVDAVRGADGSTSLRFETSVPVRNGDEHLLVPADGIIPIGEDPFPRSLLQDSELRLPRCLSLVKAADSEGYDVGYDVVLAPGCSGAAAFPLRLETPWSNVVGIRRVSTARQWASRAGLVVGSFFAGLGAVLLVVNKAAVQSPALTGAAVAPLAAGVALDAWSLPGLVTPTKTSVIGPPRARTSD